MNTAVGSQARILAVGEYRPAQVMSNAQLPDSLAVEDSWVRQRTGIVSRHIADPEDSVESMAAAAAAKAIAAAGLSAEAIDLLVLASCSRRRQVPGGAGVVAHLVGAVHAGAFDLNAACAGFCYGLSVAADAIRAGSARHVIVVGAERMTGLVDWTDAGSAILFGDGAGAVVVGPAEQAGIGPVVWGSDGSQAELIALDESDLLRMDGRAVFRWATTALAPIARRICELGGVEPAQLAAIIPHQANLRIVTALARDLDAPQAVVAEDVVTAGNTSGASIPLALADLVRRGAVSSGDVALLLAFGAGLSWAGQLVEIP